MKRIKIVVRNQCTIKETQSLAGHYYSYLDSNNHECVMVTKSLQLDLPDFTRHY